jgi:LCP family protein required for cell wall assembly
VVVFVVVVAAAGGVGYAAFELNQIHRVHVKDLAPTTGPSVVTVGGKKVKVEPGSFTVLLIGSDARSGATKSGADVGNATTNAENLSDSIILVRVSPRTDKIALLSIPRDLWVSVPGIGMAKINAAYSGGDPSRLIEVIQHDLGIPVNHFASVSFDSFEQIADAIGGVEQYFPTPAVDALSDLNIPKAGCTLLKGPTALAFVRSRHYQYIEPGQEPAEQQLPESDLARIQRQQAFIKNAIAKIKREGILSHPSMLVSLIPSITKNLTVDQTFSDSGLISLAEDFSHIDANSIPNTTYPVQNITVGTVQALSGLPSADAAVIAQFESVGTVATKTPTTAKKKSTTPTTTMTTVPHGRISVEVENGSGTADQATAAGNALQAAGYNVSTLSDAQNFRHVDNLIRYGPAGEAAAKTLQRSLAGGANLSPASSLNGTNLVLVTGSKYNGVTTTTSPSTSTTIPVPSSTGTIYGSTATIQADSSSFYDGVYIPPGREPGQKVETCGN